MIDYEYSITQSRPWQEKNKYKTTGKFQRLTEMRKGSKGRCSRMEFGSLAYVDYIALMLAICHANSALQTASKNRPNKFGADHCNNDDDDYDHDASNFGPTSRRSGPATKSRQAESKPKWQWHIPLGAAKTGRPVP